MVGNDPSSAAAQPLGVFRLILDNDDDAWMCQILVFDIFCSLAFEANGADSNG